MFAATTPPKPHRTIITRGGRAFRTSVSPLEIPLVSAIIRFFFPSLSQAFGRRNFRESWFSQDDTAEAERLLVFPLFGNDERRDHTSDHACMDLSPISE